jgi:hypothetical protein
MTKSYTKQAQAECKAYVEAHRHFLTPAYSLGESEATFNLNDAASLIRRAQLEKQLVLRDIERKRGQEEALGQQREDISLLPDREAEKIQAEWRELAEAQARSYSEARNRNAHPRSTLGTDPSITEGVISWIKRTKLRGGLGGRKMLKRNKA